MFEINGQPFLHSGKGFFVYARHEYYLTGASPE